MAGFLSTKDEEAGVRRQYGTTKDGVSGQTEQPLAEVSDEFMLIYREEQPVLREVDDAVAAACAGTRRALGIEDGDTRPTAVVDVPFSYGTLSLSTQSENVRTRVSARLDEMVDSASLAIVRSIELEEISPTTNVDRAAGDVVAHMEGLMVLAKARRDPGLLRGLGPTIRRLLT